MKGILVLILFLTSTVAFSQTVNVVLKNSKVIFGELIDENPSYIIIKNDIGDIKVDRESIESITYNPFIKMKTTYREPTNKNDTIPDGYKFVLNDRIVVYLTNGNAVSGLLLAKSLDMIMIQTEVGNLTIPKKDLQKIEYVSSEYAERGDVVIVRLNNGTSVEGNIYFEDSDNLVVDTQIGRLTIEKKYLQSIEYTGQVGYPDNDLVNQYSNLSTGRSKVQPRLDVISLGLSPAFGDDFQPGYNFTYESRFLLSQSQGFYFSGVGELGVTYFTLNQENFQDNPFGVTAKGGALITTIGGGGAISVYPQESAFFDFSIAAYLEGNLIYKNLELTYPSFPSQNSTESETEFLFGAATKVSLDFIFDSFRLGLAYDLHFVFGDDDYNVLSINFTKAIF